MGQYFSTALYLVGKERDLVKDPRRSAAINPKSATMLTEGYSTELFGCFSDLPTCCGVLLCGHTLIPSCLTFASSIGETPGPLHYLCLPAPIWTRAHIRRANGFGTDEHCTDLMTYICCFHCATCQDCAEIKRIQKQRSEQQEQQQPVVLASPYLGYPSPGFAPPGQPVFAPSPQYGTPLQVCPVPPPGYGIPPEGAIPPTFEYPQPVSGV
jgi:hypothetical protein